MPTFANETHNISTRHSTHNNYQFNSSQQKTKAQKSFTANCVRIWNSIPNLFKAQADIQKCNVEKFSLKLKEHYLWVNNHTTYSVKQIFQ